MYQHCQPLKANPVLTCQRQYFKVLEMAVSEQDIDTRGPLLLSEKLSPVVISQIFGEAKERIFSVKVPHASEFCYNPKTKRADTECPSLISLLVWESLKMEMDLFPGKKERLVRCQGCHEDVGITSAALRLHILGLANQSQFRPQILIDVINDQDSRHPRFSLTNPQQQ